MKKILLFFSYIIAIGCAKDKVAPSHGSANFSMSAVSRNANGGRMSANSTPTAVLLSIKDNNGNFTYENKKLTLTAFGQGYVSESLQLNVGNYTLTQFIVLNARDTTIYAAPLEGSDLAQYVSDPLPINFTVMENGSTTVVPEVIAVEQDDKPASFGYVDFGFKVVKRLTSIKVYENSSTAINTFIPLYIKKFFYDKGRVIRIENYDIGLNDSLYKSVIKYFEYDDQGRIVFKKIVLPPEEYPDHTFNTSYEYNGSKTTMHLFEMNGNVKSPENLRYFIKTNTGFTYSDYTKTVDYVIDKNGDIVSQTFNGNVCSNYKYDNHPNPLYLPQDFEDFTDWEVLSKNNLLSSCYNTCELQYDNQGHPLSEIISYTNSNNKFKYEFTYLK